MVPIAIGLNINWVAIGDRFNLYHVMVSLGLDCEGLSRALLQMKLFLTVGQRVPVMTQNV